MSPSLPVPYACLTLAAQCTYLVDDLFLKEGHTSFRDVFAELVRRGGDAMRTYARPAYLSMLAQAREKYLKHMDDVSTVRAFDLDTIVEPVSDTSAPTPKDEAHAKRLQSLFDEYDERVVVSGLLCREAEDMYYIGMQLGPEMLHEGLINYHSFFSELVRVMGDRVRPLVKHIYMALMADVDEQTLALMDSLDNVRNFDELSNINKLGSPQTKVRKQKYQELIDETKAYRKLKDSGRRRFTPSQLESMIGIALLLASVYLVYDVFFNLFFQNFVGFGIIFVLFIIPVAIALLLKYVFRLKVTDRYVPLVFFFAVLLPWLFLRTNVWFASGPISQKSYPVFNVSEDTDDRTCSIFIRMDDGQQKRFDFTSNSGYTRDQIFNADRVTLTTQSGLWGPTVIKDLKLIDTTD